MKIRLVEGDEVHRRFGNVFADLGLASRVLQSMNAYRRQS
jgi:hypothetical protein